MEKYDFSGWATRYNIKCADGRVLLKGAFDDCDGKTVPLVWNHLHDGPENVLGHAILEKRDEGVYAYCYLNDTEKGKDTKDIVKHGDVTQLSIYANKLKQKGPSVFHGVIRELSVVLSGANPEANIDSVIVHGDDGYDGEAIIFAGEDDNYKPEPYLEHSAKKEEEKKPAEEEKKEPAEEKEKEPMAEEKKEEKKTEDGGKTVEEVFNSMNEEQKNVVYAMIGAALEEAGGGDDDEEDEKVKHNVFDNDYEQGNYLSHADEEQILNMAKASQIGSFQTALGIFEEENGLQHDAIAGGFVQPPTPGNVTMLFPEYKEVRPGAPELVTSDQGWITTVMNKVHKSPISRIRTSHVDIRNLDSLRAKGYVKGKEKALAGNFKLARRTTDPQTIYVKNALHRDDIIDITDFDYVQYLYNIDKMMLNEELATAIMIGDGREDGDADKIYPDKIRPIWTDDDLYCIHKDIDFSGMATELNGTGSKTYFGDNYIKAEAMINTVLYARENYKGTGTPDMYVTPHMLNVMLLARDRNGRRIYSSKAELASALNVGEIYTVEQFAGKTRTVTVDGDEVTKGLVALIVNLSDYALGATKGGQVTHFTQFDIDFNQEKSLLETRVSGALTKLYSAIAIEEVVEDPSNP